MARISLWKNGVKNADYRFTDRMISEFFSCSGTILFVHLYEGTFDADGGTKPVTEIQDVLFQENRDRKYSENVFEIHGTYTIQDSGGFDLRQFGFFMNGDALFIEVHLNDMFALLGRRIMPGDVIELPHMRDDTLLDGGEAINGYYVVEDSSKASGGYSATWWPHIWRLKVIPMTGAQEFSDILDKNNKDPFGLDTGTKLRDLLSTEIIQHDANNAILDEAEKFIRNFETRQFYFVPGEEIDSQLPWIWAGDGVPPNGATLLGSGNSFPLSPSEGDYYLRTNYSPAQLFRRVGAAWRFQEQDYRMGRWSAMHRTLEAFINDTSTTTLADGKVIKQKIALSKAVRPPADF